MSLVAVLNATGQCAVREKQDKEEQRMTLLKAHYG
jgi:hypothetical protein